MQVREVVSPGVPGGVSGPGVALFCTIYTTCSGVLYRLDLRGGFGFVTWIASHKVADRQWKAENLMRLMIALL